MADFFNNKRFLDTMNKLPYGKERTLEIMQEMHEKREGLSIDVFICILHKRIDRRVSHMGMGSGLYESSVELWNQYVFDNCKCDFRLLISYEDICF
jgi:hypothetical protein